jgi:HPt (histidine-containing phosphotransfer) domain-containing protein
MLSLDVEYNESEEAKFINEMYKAFTTEIKSEFLKAIDKLNNGEENSIKVNGSYLG